MNGKEMKVGVIGAGVMGRGVAIRFAANGYEVILLDNDPVVINKVLRDIQREVKFMSMTSKSYQEEQVMEHIKASTTYKDLAECHFIIENVPEDFEIKKPVYLKLEEVCRKECIYLVNTSCIPITKMAALTGRPDRVIGVHFMNPVPLKNFSEVIKGYYTSDETIEAIQRFMGSAGIDIEIIQDSAGFVSNRLSHIFMNEAAQLVYEGIAAPEQIDRIFEEGFGHKMGPLATADLIGLDTVLDSLKVLYDFYEDPKFKASPKLKLMVAAGHAGRKSGKGFYNY